MSERVLRRTTFSGRLLRATSDEIEEGNRYIWKGLGSMVLDIAIVLTVTCSLFLWFSGKGITPYERPLPCADESIRNPFKENTVGIKHLLAVSLASPFFIIGLVEAIIYYNSKGSNRFQKFFATTTIIYLKYLLVYAGCTFMMEFLKCYVGRLRPHFVSVCRPDWSRVDCSNPNSFIEPKDLICTNPETRRIRTARTSFPSGHTAAAFHVFFFLYIYLQRIAKTVNLPHVTLVRNVFIPIYGIWAVFTAVTRVTDYWHFPTDVLGGFILAIVFVAPAFFKSWTSMPLPKFELLNITDNAEGWGPPPSTTSDNEVFQQFNKGDRIGRVADWLGVDRMYRRGNDRYNERVYGSAATAGSQFDYVHGLDEKSFQMVDSSRPIQRNAPRNFRTRQIQLRKLMQKELEKREFASQTQNLRMKRSIAKEQQKAFKMWQRRGGNARQGHRNGRLGGDRPKERLPSVQVRSEWTVLEEMNLSAFSKLALPSVNPGEDIGDHQYGILQYFDKAVDRATVKNAIPLQRCAGVYYHETTTEDAVIQELAQTGVGNVFGTDIILATLMTAPRSVYSWDIVAYRVGDKLFFDKRNTRDILNPVETLTVSETSTDPPPFDGAGINNGKDLATEAFYINQNFRRQIVKRNEEGYKMAHPEPPFDDEEAGDNGTGYRYRKWNLGTGVDGKPVELVVRTELDAVMMGPKNNVQFMTIKAFNEWDSSLSGGVDWRTKLDVQKGAVLATEIKNNSAKVAKWTLQALLAGADIMKLGYVSRANFRSTQNHVILGSQYVKPMEFANNISLSMDNCWGILRCVIDSCMKQKPGKYLLMKDPQAPIIRLYALPDGTFESEHDESEEESSDEDQ
ncbi:unnamed protein product [Caenorhabditis bovis]|uniref:Eukaryotic translation initiation factor 3 subunit D n=1 Tax=Caenorhabditis bovis TaxID=2654633 RepID=A0A8S1FCE7_9PELO|nr:unnamed protein product [Caenorhabditis bovis]